MRGKTVEINAELHKKIQRLCKKNEVYYPTVKTFVEHACVDQLKSDGVCF